MEQGYEKRLLGSPYKSPAKTGSPMKTPTKENYMDRYIPSRSNAKWKEPVFKGSRNLFNSPTKPPSGTLSELDPLMNDLNNLSSGIRTGSTRISPVSGHSNTSSANRQNPTETTISADQPPRQSILSTLVHNELVENANSPDLPSTAGAPSTESAVLAPRENLNLFSYKIRKESPCKLKSSPYSLSPVSEKSQRLLQAPQKYTRYISRMPYKVLDAPDLQDDFYLNLVDWSSQNVLAVGLGSSVYLWNAFTSQVTRLCDFSDETDAISSVSWTKKGTHLAVATYRGRVLIWDVESTQCVRRLDGHMARVGALAWNGDLLASGSRDRQILLRDIRADAHSGGGHPSGSATPVPVSATVATTTSASGNTTTPLQPQQTQVGGNANQTCVSGSVSLLHIDRELLSNSVMCSAASGMATASGPTTPNSTFLAPLTHHTRNSIVTQSTPADLGTTCSGAVRILKDHKQEVCGLKWSPDAQYLASGGNDNRLLVWSASARSFGAPLLAYEEHVAAVKAIAWSPHHHGLLASGGGTADRCVRFWNTLSGQALRAVETESQVCNLAWSEHSNELVSTHGYSQNQIVVWHYPTLRQLARLTGHSSRVLYLAVSPDGENVVTGAGDETLRFWAVFARSKAPKPISSTFNLFGAIR